MDYGKLIEILTLVSSAITALVGLLSSINNRRKADAAMPDAALGRAKTTQDIVRADPSYMEQAQQLQRELARAQRELAAARAAADRAPRHRR